MARDLADSETLARYVRRVAAIPVDPFEDEAPADDDVVFRAVSESLKKGFLETLRADPQVLAARRRAASRLREEGDLSDAREILEEAASAARENLGEDDPATLAIESELGMTLSDLNDLQAAAALQQRILGRCIALYGQRSLEVAQPKLNLAVTAKRNGELKTALLLQKDVLGMLGAKLSYNDPQTVAVRLLVEETEREIGEEPDETHKPLVDPGCFGC
jgi:tetratricopeptide (TPR) repeat protein